MSPAVKQWITRIGTIGHVARAVIFGLVGIFLVKAAIDYKAKEAIGLEGALTKLVNTTYGPWAPRSRRPRLIAFAVYSISDARYRRIYDRATVAAATRYAGLQGVSRWRCAPLSRKLRSAPTSPSAGAGV